MTFLDTLNPVLVTVITEMMFFWSGYCGCSHIIVIDLIIVLLVVS